MNKLRTCMQVLAIMAAAVITCCLCQRDVSTGTMKTKRKKFMGGSCQVPRKVLEDLSLKHFDRKVSTLSGMEVEYLCYTSTMLQFLQANSMAFSAAFVSIFN